MHLHHSAFALCLTTALFMAPAWGQIYLLDQQEPSYGSHTETSDNTYEYGAAPTSTTPMALLKNTADSEGISLDPAMLENRKMFITLLALDKSPNITLSHTLKIRALFERGQYADVLNEYKKNPDVFQEITLQEHLLVSLLNLAYASLRLEQDQAKADQFIEQYENLQGRKSHPFYQSLKKLSSHAGPSERLIKIGLFLPLSGPLESLGKSIQQAVNAAIFTLKDDNILVYNYDVANETALSRAATQARRDGIHVAIGPVQGEQASALRQQLYGVPILTFSNDIKHLGNDTYSLGYLLPDQIHALTDVALSHEKQHIALLATENTLGQYTLDALQQSARDNTLFEIGKTTFFPESKEDIGQELRNLTEQASAKKRLQKELASLKARVESSEQPLSEEEEKRLQELENGSLRSFMPFDALLLPILPKQAATIAPQLAYFDIYADSTDLLLLQNLAALAENKAVPAHLVGSYIASAQDGAQQKRFNQLYRSVNAGHAHPLAVLAYDAVNIIQEVALLNGGSFSTETLLRAQGFTGLGGALRFLDNGTNTRTYGIYKLRYADLAPLYPAPSVMPWDVREPQAPSRGFFPSWGTPRRDTDKAPSRSFYIEWN